MKNGFEPEHWHCREGTSHNPDKSQTEGPQTPQTHEHKYIPILTESERERERDEHIYSFIIYLRLICLGAVWVQTNTFTQIVIHSRRCNCCNPYTESDPFVIWSKSCPSIAKENLFGAFKSLKNDKGSI